MSAADGWQRLSPRMLLVHPLYEGLRELPLLVAAVMFGSATANPVWVLAVLWVIAAIGVTRWFTTTYRIETDPEAGRVQLRAGLLRRKLISLPRNRIRAVETDSRLLHRLLGLTVLRVSTGQKAAGDGAFELNAVDSRDVPRLRAALLSHTGRVNADVTKRPAARATVLAQWRPSWLRYSPLSLSGLVSIGVAVGALFQSGVWLDVQSSAVGSSMRRAAEQFGAMTTAAVIVAVVVVSSMVLAVLRSLVTYGNLVLVRRSERAGDVLTLSYGLLRVREHTYDLRRLRGGTLRRPLLVRLFGGARLDAAMTGITGDGESSMLLPPCPKATAERVLGGLVADPAAVIGPLRRHGRVAARRRWTRALLLPALAGAVVLVAQLLGPVAPWCWIVWAILTAGAALLARDRVQALGHRVDAHWLSARNGSWEQRRYCIATEGIVGWTVRQSWFQRRAGVATLIAATAAGVKAYRVIDVPQEWAWSVAAQASPWVARSAWALTVP